MPIFAGKKFTEEAWNHLKLDEHLQKAEEDLKRPILQGLTGAERYYAAQRYHEARAAMAIHGHPASNLDSDQSKDKTFRVDVDTRKTIDQWLIDELYREYKMAKNDLQNDVATRAEVIPLALAVRQLSHGFDDEIEQFRSKSSTIIREIENAQTTSQRLKYEWEALKKEWHAKNRKTQEKITEVNAIIKQLNNHTKNLQGYAEKINRSSQCIDNLQKQFNRQATDLRRTNQQTKSIKEKTSGLTKKINNLSYWFNQHDKKLGELDTSYQKLSEVEQSSQETREVVHDLKEAISHQQENLTRIDSQIERYAGHEDNIKSIEETSTRLMTKLLEQRRKIENLENNLNHKLKRFRYSMIVIAGLLAAVLATSILL